MQLSRDIVERRAIQAGVKASKLRNQVVSEQELLALRVQTMALWLRISLVVLGVGLVVSGWYGWPLDSSKPAPVSGRWCCWLAYWPLAPEDADAGAETGGVGA